MGNDVVDDLPEQDRYLAKRSFLSVVKGRLRSPGSGSGFIETSGGFLFTVLIAWMIELTYGLVCEGWPGGLRIFCILWFASGAAFFIGTIGGFLFGIPKARPQWQSPDGNIAPASGATGEELSTYRDNTNLEEVSDWLTKIIIGLGLVEFQNIVSAVVTAGATVGDSIDPVHQFGGAAIATGSLIVGFATGFIYYYIWTRVYLMKRFSERSR